MISVIFSNCTILELRQVRVEDVKGDDVDGKSSVIGSFGFWDGKENQYSSEINRNICRIRSEPDII